MPQSPVRAIHGALRQVVVRTFGAGERQQLELSEGRRAPGAVVVPVRLLSRAYEFFLFQRTHN
jgi:hypothetical protein